MFFSKLLDTRRSVSILIVALLMARLMNWVALPQ